MNKSIEPKPEIAGPSSFLMPSAGESRVFLAVKQVANCVMKDKHELSKHPGRGLVCIKKKGSEIHITGTNNTILAHYEIPVSEFPYVKQDPADGTKSHRLDEFPDFENCYKVAKNDKKEISLVLVEEDVLYPDYESLLASEDMAGCDPANDFPVTIAKNVQHMWVEMFKIYDKGVAIAPDLWELVIPIDRLYSSYAARINSSKSVVRLQSPEDKGFVRNEANSGCMTIFIMGLNIGTE